jgi:hypothetical protein
MAHGIQRKWRWHTVGRAFTVPYYIQVPASSVGNQSSLTLTGITSIVGAYLIFPPGTGGQLQYRFYEMRSGPTQSNIQPSGQQIGRDLINDPFYVGDGIAYPILWQLIPQFTNEVIVFAATNNSPITLNAQALVTVKE